MSKAGRGAKPKTSAGKNLVVIEEELKSFGKKIWDETIYFGKSPYGTWITGSNRLQIAKEIIVAARSDDIATLVIQSTFEHNSKYNAQGLVWVQEANPDAKEETKYNLFHLCNSSSLWANTHRTHPHIIVTCEQRMEDYFDPKVVAKTWRFQQIVAETPLLIRAKES